MQIKVSIEFNTDWVLSRQNDDVLPVQLMIRNLKDYYSLLVLENSVLSCELLIEFDNAEDTEKVSEKIAKILSEVYNISDPSDVLEYTITNYYEEPVVDSEIKETSELTSSTQLIIEESDDNSTNDIDKLEEVLSKINALVGADEFKRLADECVRIAPKLLKYNTIQTFIRRSYIFSINDGNGLSTYLELFADLLEALNLFKFSDRGRIAEEKLPTPVDKENALEAFSSVLVHINRFSKNHGKIICIDISEWMTKVTGKTFRELLSVLDDHVGENIVVFRVPFVEKEILKGLKKGISDLLFVKSLSFVPFDGDELTKCAQESLAKIGFTMEDEAWDVFDARITEEKSDGRFYGINTVNKVINEMIYHKQLHNIYNDVDDTVIKKDEILDLVSSYDEYEKSGLQLLDNFIGMESIRKRVEEIVAQIEMSSKNKNLGVPCIHMRFVGNPGTGKTTVARVIGKILKEKGILRNGNFFEYSGRDFCGRYVGETAPKTAAMCRDAYGSILFIDEAYALYRGDSFSNADYGREAIDTLIAEMENHRSDLVVIMAGYTDEMNELMKANAGLESRMPYVIEFPNYTKDQLFDIFMMNVKKSFKYGEGFEEAVKIYFGSIADSVLISKEFSNARFVRNLFERTWGKAVLRTQINKEPCTVLTKEDFFLASSEKEFSEVLKKETQTLGFI